MDVLKVILGVVLIIFSIGAVALILRQEGNDGGMSSIMGGSNTDSEFGRRGTGGKNRIITRWTTICSVAIMVLAVAIALISKLSA